MGPTTAKTEPVAAHEVHDIGLSRNSIKSDSRDSGQETTAEYDIVTEEIDANQAPRPVTGLMTKTMM